MMTYLLGTPPCGTARKTYLLGTAPLVPKGAMLVVMFQ